MDEATSDGLITWAYLGPEGTFTEQAAQQLRRSARVEVTLAPMATVTAALDAVRTGTVEGAVVPIENSVEGIVALTQDELIHGEPLLVAAEAYVPIRFDLYTRPGGTLDRIRTVGSHPHGLAQVRDVLRRELPQAELVVTASTADAARQVADGLLDAAACAPVAGEHYGLAAVLGDIGSGRAVTRFVLVRRLESPAERTGLDRTSLVATVPNTPGSLVALLHRIADRGINLTRIESRPTREVMGEYLFILDADGHATDAPMAGLLQELTASGELLRFLGSYPRGEQYG